MYCLVARDGTRHHVPMPHWARIALTAPLALTAVALPATPAAAHGQLALSDPLPDSTDNQPKTDLQLYFTEAPASYAYFTLTTPSGRRVDNGWRTGEPKRL